MIYSQSTHSSIAFYKVCNFDPSLAKLFLYQSEDAVRRFYEKVDKENPVGYLKKI